MPASFLLAETQTKIDSFDIRVREPIGKPEVMLKSRMSYLLPLASHAMLLQTISPLSLIMSGNSSQGSIPS